MPVWVYCNKIYHNDQVVIVRGTHLLVVGKPSSYHVCRPRRYYGGAPAPPRHSLLEVRVQWDPYRRGFTWQLGVTKSKSSSAKIFLPALHAWARQQKGLYISSPLCCRTDPAGTQPGVLPSTHGWWQCRSYLLNFWHPGTAGAPHRWWLLGEYWSFVMAVRCLSSHVPNTVICNSKQ